MAAVDGVRRPARTRANATIKIKFLRTIEPKGGEFPQAEFERVVEGRCGKIK
jgi:hypothetical protein